MQGTICLKALPKRLVARFTLALISLGFAAPALGHEARSLALGLTGGFVHPLTGPDHLLAMVAVGLWGAFLGRPLIYLLPMVFPAVMALGGIAGMARAPFPPVELGIAVSVLVLGLAVLARWAAPVWLAVPVVAVFGLFHGYAHGLELPSMADPIGFSLGFVLATGLLHVAGVAVGTIRNRPHGEVLLRALGGLIAVSGTWFLANAAAG